MTAFQLRVNGIELRAEAEPRTHLADFLREELLLTGLAGLTHKPLFEAQGAERTDVDIGAAFRG